MKRSGILFLSVLSVLALASWLASDARATICTNNVTAETTTIGTNCGGAYSDLTAYDDVEECLQEAQDGGVYKLEHKWDFSDVPAGTHTFNFGGWRNCGANDNFQFGSNNDPNQVSFQTISGALIDYCDTESHSVALGSTLTSGYFGIGVWGTKGSPDNKKDNVNVDLVTIDTAATDTCPSADYSTNPGTKTGTYANVCASDNSYEVFTEALVSGVSRLIHIWQFNDVPDGEKTLCIEGKRPSNADGDDFQFGYNTDHGAMYLVITDAVINTTSDTAACYPFPADNVHGTIYVYLDDTAGGGTNNTVSVDRVYIHTEPICN